MKNTLRYLFFFLILTGNNMASRASDLYVAKDVVALDALNRYRQYFIENDTSALKNWTVSQTLYNQLLSSLQEKQVTCLTALEMNYSTRLVMDEFINSRTGAGVFRLDSIAPVKVSRLDGCGGITFKKVDARAYFRQGDYPPVELPLTLILLEDSENKYPLMMQILNSKILQHGQ